jgi:hypothetical protein
MNAPAILLAGGLLLASMLSSAPASADSRPDSPGAAQPGPVEEILDTLEALATGSIGKVDNTTSELREDVPVVDPCDVVIAPPVDPVPPRKLCCGEFVLTEPGGSTRWSDPDGPGATGINEDPVLISATSLIPGAAKLWKEDPGVGEGSATGWGVEFLISWVACPSPHGLPAVIRVQSDNSNQVFLNNQPVGACGTWGMHSNCFGAVQAYSATMLPYPLANTLRVHVMNGAGNNWVTNPAFVAYRVDF